MARSSANKDIIFVEKTLKNYKAFKAEQYNLNIALSLIEKEKDEAIASENLSASIIDDTPHTCTAGTKHFKLGSNELKMLEEKEKLMKVRLKYLNSLLEAINSSLNSLNQKDREIVIMFYVQRKSLYDIGLHCSLAPAYIYEKKRGLIAYITKSLKVFNYNV